MSKLVEKLLWIERDLLIFLRYRLRMANLLKSVAVNRAVSSLIPPFHQFLQSSASVAKNDSKGKEFVVKGPGKDQFDLSQHDDAVSRSIMRR